MSSFSLNILTAFKGSPTYLGDLKLIVLYNSSISINFFNNKDFIIKEISVYDVTGKKIQHWSVYINNNGSDRISWNGKDERGFEIGSGLYFVRFEGSKKSITKKVTYLK